MFDLALTAFRNILRNRRRSILTLMSITIGGAGLAAFNGFIQFSYDGLRELTIYSQLGHMQVFAKEYETYKVSDPDRVVIKNPAAVEEVLRDIPGVTAASGRLTFSGLASAGKNSLNVQVIGVDPKGELGFSDFEIIKKGRSLLPGDSEHGMIGRDLANGLGVDIGDWVTILTSTVDGMLNAVDFQVGGIFITGSGEYDRSIIKIPINLARKVRDTPSAENLIILFESTDQFDAIRPQVEAAVAALPEELETRTWHDMAQFYRRVVIFYDGIFRVFTAIAGVVVLFSVANTMTMAVMERTAEIGALRAIGAKRSTIISMFLWEGVGYGLIGGILSAVAAYAIAFVVNTSGGFEMPPPPSMSSSYQAFLTVTPENLWSVFQFVALVALLSSLYPAWLASRVKITDALHSS